MAVLNRGEDRPHEVEWSSSRGRGRPNSMKQRAGLDFTQLAQASTDHGGMFRLFRFCFGGYYIPPIANRQRTWSIMVIRNKHGDFRLSTGCWMYTKGVGKLQQLWWSSQNQPISGCSELGSPCRGETASSWFAQWTQGWRTANNNGNDGKGHTCFLPSAMVVLLIVLCLFSTEHIESVSPPVLVFVDVFAGYTISCTEHP